MEVKAEIAVLSNLSDLQIEVEFERTTEMIDRVNVRIEFCKYLICKLKGNLNQYIDVDAMFEDFMLSYVKLV